MSAVSSYQVEAEPLVAGDCLPREQFLRRWDAIPTLKRAELIQGVVYMPPPLSADHGVHDGLIATWLGSYAARTPGCEVGMNATWHMLNDAPQPDAHLRLVGKSGGSWVEGGFFHGAPELISETCLSSSSYDLHQKKSLYAAAGVKEYLAAILHTHEVRWHRLSGSEYQLLPCSPDGIIESIVFPGLWLNVVALWRRDSAGVLDTLQRGLQTPEHATFVTQLAMP